MICLQRFEPMPVAPRQAAGPQPCRWRHEFSQVGRFAEAGTGQHSATVLKLPYAGECPFLHKASLSAARVAVAIRSVSD